MRKLWIGCVGLVMAGACGPQATTSPSLVTTDTTRTIRRESRTVATVVSGDPVSLDQFQPAVPAFGEAIHCDTAEAGAERVVLVKFTNGPGGAERDIALRYDASGTLVRFSDVRGDIRGSGPRTAISVNMVNGQVFATNERSASPAIALGTWNAAADLPNLGAPRAMIERITRECGTAAR